jgi:hypothetical protein
MINECTSEGFVYYSDYLKVKQELDEELSSSYSNENAYSFSLSNDHHMEESFDIVSSEVRNKEDPCINKIEVVKLLSQLEIHDSQEQEEIKAQPSNKRNQKAQRK